MSEVEIVWPNGKTYTVQPATAPLMLGPERKDGKRFLHRGTCHKGGDGSRVAVPEELLGSLIDGERLREFNAAPRTIFFCDRVMK